MAAQHRLDASLVAPRRALVALLSCAACGDVAAPEGAEPREVAPPPCERGQIAGPTGICMPVGIQGCADPFVDEDGLCRPRLDTCAQGTIPRFEQGCFEVGIVRTKCADAFIDNDHLCRPSTIKCADQPGTFAVPGEGCVPLDGTTGCGVGTWGNIPDDANNVYVDPAADPGGDGTRNAPLGTISAALERVTAGGRVVLAAGTYFESVDIDSDVELAGRCASMVHLQSPPNWPPLRAIVVARRHASINVHDISIVGPGVGLLAVSGAAVIGDRLHIQQTTVIGAGATGLGSQVSLRHTLIEDALSGALPGALGTGVYVELGGRAAIASSAIARAHDVGLYVAEGAAMDVTDTLVEGHPSADPLSRGVQVDDRGQLALRDSAVVGSRYVGLALNGDGIEATATGNLIAGNLASGAEPAEGGGVLVLFGARLALAGNALVDNRHVGVGVEGARSEVTSDGDLIADTVPRDEEVSGSGVIAAEGATISLASSAVVRSFAYGVDIHGAGTTAAISSTLVEQSGLGAAESSAGGGLIALSGAQVSITGSALVRNHQLGLSVQDADTRLSATGTLVEDTQPRLLDRRLGRGAQVVEGAEASFDAALFDMNRETSLFLESGAEATVTRSLIQNTLADDGNGELGMGVAVEQSALTLSGSVLRDNRVAGVALAWGAVGELSQTLVDGVLGGRFTRLDLVPPETYDDVGDGILALFGSSLTLSGCRATGAVRAGLLFDDSSGVLTGVVADHDRFGLVLQGKRRPELGDGNEFKDNEEQDVVSGAILPIPDRREPVP